MKAFIDLVTETQAAIRTVEAQVRKDSNLQMVKATTPFYDAPIIIKIGNTGYNPKSVQFQQALDGVQTQFVIELDPIDAGFPFGATVTPPPTAEAPVEPEAPAEALPTGDQEAPSNTPAPASDSIQPPPPVEQTLRAEPEEFASTAAATD